MNSDISILKDKVILFTWIIGLMIAIILLWNNTQPFQAKLLLKNVNNALETTDNAVTLSMLSKKQTSNSGLLGYWYSVDGTTDSMFVFGLLFDGILISCGARVSEEGEVTEVIPLSTHARDAIVNVPESVIKMHIHRIEANLK